jgi:formylglycine-generating enzyme required for sulfatase activity
VFISYSHADRAWVEQLKRMMAPLLRGSGQELRLWDDSRIEPGMKWREEIETALAEAKVALLLVSDTFLASDFVMGQEVPKLLAAAEAEGVTVLWVSLSPSFVEETEIHHYQAVLPPHRHLEAMAEVEVKEALKTIGLAIRKALQAAPVKAIPSEPTVGPPPAPDPDPPPAAGSAQVASADLPTETIELETARLHRQGTGWQVERQPLRVERALLPLPEGTSLPLLWIPGGEFVMGSPPDELERQDDEGPQHRVRLGGFWMGQAPVTQAQWRALARLVPPLGQRWQRQLPANPSFFQPEGEDSNDQRPVERVFWHDAMEFCRRFDTLLPPGSGLRCTLPSEAQWEFACRGGMTTPFAFGHTISPELANYDGTFTYANGPKGEFRGQTTPVGMFPANGWGLQDMHGNVWEWCLDHWHDTYGDAPFDGRAWIDPGAKDLKAEDARPRLLRGGSWYGDPRFCRSAHRDRGRPGSSDDNIGFRVVCLPQDPSLNT